MVRLTIDGNEVNAKPGRTILEVTREQGLSIPTLCHNEALEPFGACRLCVVEVKAGEGWRLVTSCTYPCSDELEVRTASEGVRRSRRMTVELLMASAAHVPLIQQLAEEMNVGPPRFSMERSDCILCGLCVRVCREIVGIGAISVMNRGIEKKVSTPFHSASGDCIECGTCVLVCPTGAISFDDITGGGSSVHKMTSEFQDLHCKICGRGHREQLFVDHAALLAEAERSMSTVEVECSG
jgi:NADH dehydrogenase/NADH:ubiquinone oxidoreductase subunit G